MEYIFGAREERACRRILIHKHGSLGVMIGRLNGKSILEPAVDRLFLCPVLAVCYSENQRPPYCLAKRGRGDTDAREIRRHEYSHYHELMVKLFR